MTERDNTRWRVAVSDLDDTLLHADGTLSPRSEAAIGAWLASGRRFVIATGRPYRSIGERLPPLLHNVPWICYNGAETRLNGATIYSHLIPEHALTALIGDLLDTFPETTIGLELDGLLWLNRARSQSNPHQRVVDLRTIAHKPAAKVLLFSDQLDNLLAHLTPPPAGVRLMPSGRYAFLQLMAEGADKVTALRHLLEAWDEDLAHVVAFGDDINDVDLLRAAGLGVAVANAFPPARAAARRIAPSNQDDGVAQVLEEVLADSPSPP